MNVRVRHPGAPPADVDLGPSRARIAGYRGVLVVGGVSPADAQRASQRMCAQRARDAAKGLTFTGELTGRPLLPSVPFVWAGRGHAYATDEERLAARRESWRRTARRKAAEKSA